MQSTDFQSPEAIKKRADARAANAARINVKTLKTERRKPKEIANKTKSIQNFCRECVGWNAGDCSSLSENIRECTAPECWLYPWRNGKLDMDS